MLRNQAELAEVAGKYEQLGYWEPLTLGEQLKLVAGKYQHKVAVIDGERRLTYAELDAAADRLAAGLSALGLGRNDNIVVQLPNCISFLTLCFALFRIGARPILALPSLREAELDAICRLAEPVAYVIPTDFLGFHYEETAARLRQKHPSLRYTLTEGAGRQSGNIDLAALTGPSLALAQPPSYTDTALFLLSGGTTGTPKLIPKIHAAYAYNAKASAKRCGVTAASVYLAVLSIAHDYPLCCPGVLGTLLAGGTVVLSKTASYEEAFPLIGQEKVTITAIVPAIANLWLDALAWDETVNAASLAVVLVGAAKLELEVARQLIDRLGCKLQQGYGLGEGVTCFTALDDPEDIVCSCQGRPVSEADEVKIVDENGKEVPAGEFGELIQRGPYTFLGYYRAPELNRQCFTADGFFCTGDRARITPEGNIQLAGRIKEQINRAGENVVPAEIETYLRRHKSIKDAAVLGLPDKNLGERTCAFLITGNDTITAADISKFLHDLGVAPYKIPDQIELVDCFPFTNVGKVDKKKLREFCQEEREDGQHD